MPGRYKWTVTTPAGSTTSPKWTLASARINGRETIDDGIDLPAGQAPALDALLVLSDRGTIVRGLLRDAGGRPAPDYFVIVYGANDRDWTPPSRRVALTRPATDGAFSISGLPAGDYLIAAVTDVEQGEWMDPAFLKTLAPTSIKFSLADGETKAQDITIAAR
jgi:hypothetical protein